MNNPEDCPKRMEIPIKLLEAHLDHISGTDPTKDRLVFVRTHCSQKQTDDGINQINRAISLLKAHESVLPRIHEFANKPENQTRLLALLKVGWEKHEPAHRIAQIVAGATLLDFFGIDHQHLPKK